MSLRQHLANAAAYAGFFECLINGSSNVFEIHAESGLHLNTIRKLVLIMRRRGLVHVSAWSMDGQGRYTLAVYALGNKPDAIRPKKKTPTERSAKHRVTKRRLRLQNLGQSPTVKEARRAQVPR